MNRVLIAGGGATEFGEYPDRTGRELFAEAATSALRESGVETGAVDAFYYGNFMGEIADEQGHQGPLMAEQLGLERSRTTRVENACASGGYAVAEGVAAVRSGQADVVLVGGMERMTHLPTAETTDALAMAADALHETRAGMTFPAAYALLANAYFEEYSGSREDLAAIAVKNHEHATENPRAQFREAITREEALDAPSVASPLGLYDACPVTDGAAAAVLVSAEFAAEHDCHAPVEISGSGCAGDSLALQDRATLARTLAAERAAADAYAEAAVDPDNIDLAEVHDCFTIAEALALEALQLYEPGQAIGAARRGETTKEGDLPVNLSGGLKAKGHPVGATGVSQLVELTDLLTGRHPNSEHVPDATVGVTHNAGGTVASAAVHVLEVAE